MAFRCSHCDDAIDQTSSFCTEGTRSAHMQDLVTFHELMQIERKLVSILPSTAHWGNYDYLKCSIEYDIMNAELRPQSGSVFARASGLPGVDILTEFPRAKQSSCPQAWWPRLSAN